MKLGEYSKNSKDRVRKCLVYNVVSVTQLPHSSIIKLREDLSGKVGYLANQISGETDMICTVGGTA